jgi:hypothetical protein
MNISAVIDTEFAGDIALVGDDDHNPVSGRKPILRHLIGADTTLHTDDEANCEANHQASMEARTTPV